MHQVTRIARLPGFLSDMAADPYDVEQIVVMVITAAVFYTTACR
jgi:hypothetical protein